MKKILLPLLLFTALCACEHKPEPGDVAAQAAKAYYMLLLEGKYDAYVDGHYRPDSIPSGYREQLIANAKMFVGQQNEDHHGIKDVTVVDAKADTVKRVANVFLVFHYGDSTTEQVVVPMVYSRQMWYLK